MNNPTASTKRSLDFEVSSGVSDHLKPSGKGRTQTGQFEGGITDGSAGYTTLRWWIPSPLERGEGQGEGCRRSIEHGSDQRSRDFSPHPSPLPLGGEGECFAGVERLLAVLSSILRIHQYIERDGSRARTLWINSRPACSLRFIGDGARYRARTCDPYRVKVVLYH